MWQHSIFWRGVAALATGNGLVQIVSLALVPVLTRLYAPIHFGGFAFIMIVAGIVATVSTLRLEYAVIIPREERWAYGVVRTALGAMAIIMIIGGVIWLPTTTWAADSPVAHHLGWGLLVGMGIALYQLFFQLRIRHRHYTRTAAAQVVVGLGSPLTAITWAWIFGPTDKGLSMGFLVAHLAGIIWLHPPLDILRHHHLPTPQNVLQRFRHFPMFNLPHALLNFGTGNLPYLILGPVFGQTTVGQLSVAIGKVSKGIQWWNGSIYPVLSREVMAHLHDRRPTSHWLQRITLKQALYGSVLFIPLGIWAPQIFAWFFGQVWEPAGYYLRYLLPWLFMVWFTAPLSFLPNLLNRQREALLWEVFLFVVRLLGIGGGLLYGTVEASLVGYSMTGTLSLLLLLRWYFRILQASEAMHQPPLT